jgi:hypothetical protein
VESKAEAIEQAGQNKICSGTGLSFTYLCVLIVSKNNVVFLFQKWISELESSYRFKRRCSWGIVDVFQNVKVQA